MLVAPPAGQQPPRVTLHLSLYHNKEFKIILPFIGLFMLLYTNIYKYIYISGHIYVFYISYIRSRNLITGDDKMKLICIYFQQMSREISPQRPLSSCSGAFGHIRIRQSLFWCMCAAISNVKLRVLRISTYCLNCVGLEHVSVNRREI